MEILCKYIFEISSHSYLLTTAFSQNKNIKNYYVFAKMKKLITLKISRIELNSEVSDIAGF